MLSISTSWNHQPSLDMRQWLEQIVSFELNAIEMGYTLTSAQLEDIKQALGPLDAAVLSAAAVCEVSLPPAPGVPCSFR